MKLNRFVLKGSHQGQIILQGILQEHNIQMILERNTTCRKHLIKKTVKTKQRKVFSETEHPRGPSHVISHSLHNLSHEQRGREGLSLKLFLP